ncbi:hypothetical protein F2P56_037074 [Juglans regia]|uniref:Uncharacterized protein LOC109008288 n=2 Tax=Juglans regia TaxID=51240 RepID=A0A2I4GIY9_JUGRE|nr:uncharacterized protein LOC109008288 [Juglans regia]KAF5441980.1 hypothetical protein F2P56_037074 [Juglans regia]
MVKRRELWEHLNDQVVGSDPCIIMGDFNIIRDDSERRGGRPRPRAAMEDFNSWIDHCGLIEMRSLGRSYLARSTSDHSPMFLEMKKDLFAYGPPPFRFQQMWIDHPDFRPFVEQVWQEEVAGTGLLRLALKLKKLRGALRVWNKQIFGRTEFHLQEIQAQIDSLESALQQDWDPTTERELLVKTAKLANWRSREETRLAQMAKLRWNVEGDQNSKFFHAYLSYKRKKRVMERRLQDDTVLKTPEEVHLGAVNYFSSFLQKESLENAPDLSQIISPVITAEESALLCDIPSIDEVKKALDSIPSNSAPGPDGFGAGFFKSSWDIIKIESMSTVEEFLEVENG